MDMNHVLERGTWIPRPIEEVNRFFSDVANLERITPPELRFRILTPLPVEIRLGALIDYRLSLFGVPFDWRTEITCWEPPQRFVDTQLSGPYRKWVHLHEFTPERDGTRATAPACATESTTCCRSAAPDCSGCRWCAASSTASSTSARP